MSRKKRYQIGCKKKIKRKRKRQKLIAQGKNPDEFFSSGFWVRSK